MINLFNRQESKFHINGSATTHNRIDMQLENRMNPLYDLGQFDSPVYEVRDLKTILQQEIKDGIYHIATPDILDLYFENFENKTDDLSTIMVCFNAAVTGRSEKRGPFFAGRGVNRTLKLPLISISDPSISSYPLELAWYAGSEKYQSFQADLAFFLDQFAEKYKAKLLLFGGSGGGFASLAIASQLKTEATLLVSNPQTSISNYLYDVVKNYVQQAFPTHAASLDGVDRSNRKSTLYKIFDKYGVVHDVTSLTIPQHVRMIYLQNKSDNHVATHARPFIKNYPCKLVGANSLESENLGVYFGSWGKGHVRPGAGIMLILLKKIVGNQSINSILIDLENGLDGLNPNEGHLTFLNNAQYKLFSTIEISNNKLVVRCRVKRTGIWFTDNSLRYAFYLFCDGKKIATQNYIKGNSHEFELPEVFKKLSVRCFVKDLFDQKITGGSNVLSRRDLVRQVNVE